MSFLDSILGNKDDNQTQKMVKDPVCGMELDPNKATESVEKDGTTYYFCSAKCRKQFEGGTNQAQSHQHEGGCC